MMTRRLRHQAGRTHQPLLPLLQIILVVMSSGPESVLATKRLLTTADGRHSNNCMPSALTPGKEHFKMSTTSRSNMSQTVNRSPTMERRRMPVVWTGQPMVSIYSIPNYPKPLTMRISRDYDGFFHLCEPNYTASQRNCASCRHHWLACGHDGSSQLNIGCNHI
jgi:hypothetical protein